MRKLQPHNILILFLGLSLFGSTTMADQKIQLIFQGGTYSIAGEVPSGSTAISGFGAYGISAGATFGEKIVLLAGISLLASQGISGDTATGFEAGFRYYLFSPASSTDLSGSGFEGYINQTFRYYIGGAVRQRQFYNVLASTYIGPGIFGGIDYSIDKSYYFNLEGRYDTLAGAEETSLTQMNILLGLGITF